MCSILGIFDSPTDVRLLRGRALECSARQRHRGPDWSGCWADERALLAHERLAIVGVDSGAQPIESADGRIVLAVNGEIYNHRELRAEIGDRWAWTTDSDCEVVSALYALGGLEFLSRLNGIWAFALWDADRGRFLVARDPIGVVPLYFGKDADGRLWIASEMKALVETCTEIRDFPPGHVLDSETGSEPRPWFAPRWRDFTHVDGRPADASDLRRELEAAVQRQLMSDVPWGVLVSGGLDSSLIAALAARHAARRVESDETEAAWWPRLHTFAIGLDGSPDLAAARRVAEHLDAVHHELVYTVQEGLDSLADVIWHIESYDVTTVRASTPMYLLARRIRSLGIKMVLSGEGSDEIFGGYLYFHKAPSARALHEETVRKLDLLHKFDCLRANKAMAAWGVEARVPFLDLRFLDAAMSVDPAAKLCGDGRIEKHLLREAAAGLLPDEVLWRQKEQFSDGVGYGWIDSLQALAAREVSDADLADAGLRFPIRTPDTKEAYLYRRIFAERYPDERCADLIAAGPSIACSTPTALEWDRSFRERADPSGRAIASHFRSWTPNDEPGT